MGCETCINGCWCRVDDPGAGCGHYGCWGPRAGAQERCPLADQHAAHVAAELDVLLPRH